MDFFVTEMVTCKPSASKSRKGPFCITFYWLTNFSLMFNLYQMPRGIIGSLTHLCTGRCCVIKFVNLCVVMCDRNMFY